MTAQRKKAKYLRWYWFPRINMPVTFHLKHDHAVTWKSVIGVQVGATFIGIVTSPESAQTEYQL